MDKSRSISVQNEIFHNDEKHFYTLVFLLLGFVIVKTLPLRLRFMPPAISRSVFM